MTRWAAAEAAAPAFWMKFSSVQVRPLYQYRTGRGEVEAPSGTIAAHFVSRPPSVGDECEKRSTSQSKARVRAISLTERLITWSTRGRKDSLGPPTQRADQDAAAVTETK